VCQESLTKMNIEKLSSQIIKLEQGCPTGGPRAGCPPYIYVALRGIKLNLFFTVYMNYSEKLPFECFMLQNISLHYL